MVESALYSQNICGMLGGMYYRLSCTRVENHNIIFSYLYNKTWSLVVKALTWCAAVKSVTRTDTPLDDLVKARMQQKEERLEKSLDGFNFVLDSPESLHLVCDPGRIEKVMQYTPSNPQWVTDPPSYQDMFAVVFVILRRHTRLIELAASKVMDEREFLDASSTLINVAQAIKQRVDRLESQSGAGFFSLIECSLPLQRISSIKDLTLTSRCLVMLAVWLVSVKISCSSLRFLLATQRSLQYEWLHTNNIPEDASEPDIPDEDWDTIWDNNILPPSLDLKQFSKSDIWFDISAYKKPRRAQALEDVTTDLATNATAAASSGAASNSTGT